MRAILMADLHIGKAQWQATEGGRNARSVDTERAFAAAVDHVVREQPDVVLVGGDIFENPRVSMYAIMAWRDGVRRIVQETDAHLVAIPGNHDLPRTSESLTPVIIPDDYDRVHIVTRHERVRFTAASGETVSVACFPFVVLAPETPSYLLDPDPTADVNVVLIHAAVRSSVAGSDALPRFYAGDDAIDLGREAERFDLLCAGDFHVFTRLHPTRLACYPGSTERTSSDIWHEPEAKGVVLADTVAGTLTFLAVPTRPMHDYDLGDVIVIPEATAECVNTALANFAGSPDLAGAMVRLVVEGFPRSEREHIDWSLVRKLKASCLTFQLDLRYAAPSTADMGDRRERGRALSLAEEAAAWFADDLPEVRALALAALDVGAEVEEVAHA